MSEPRIDELSTDEFESRLRAVDDAESDDFTALVGRAGLDPRRDLRFFDFTDCKFDRQLLRGYDFTGCDLGGATFDGAKIEGAIFDCATFDSAALARAADYPEFLATDLARKPATRHRANPSRLRDLAVFREAPFAPEMVVIPAGEFMMGSDLGDDKLGEDDKAWDDEIVPGRGKRRMRIPRHSAIGRYPVTFEEYDLFCEAEKRKKPGDQGWGRRRRPVINVTWSDAQVYVAWLNGKLGGAAYRLPSEAEWEYACRAGTSARRGWADTWDPKRANGAGSFFGRRLSSVDHFPANPWGLRDMIGNVLEWCADEWVQNIAKLPSQNQPTQTRSRKTKAQSKSQAPRALRGGSWNSLPKFLRSASRRSDEQDIRNVYLGFRLSGTL